MKPRRRSPVRLLITWLVRLGTSTVVLLLVAFLWSQCDRVINGTRPQPGRPVQASDVIIDETQFDERLERFIETFNTTPTISELHRQEAHRLRAYYRGRVVHHLPDWLLSHGYELSPSSRDTLAELHQQWRQIQADYAQLGQQSHANRGGET